MPCIPIHMLRFPAWQTPTPLYFRLCCLACWRRKYEKKTSKKRRSSIRGSVLSRLLRQARNFYIISINLFLCGEGRWTQAASSLTRAPRSLSCFQRLVFFTVTPAPLNNCFWFFKELRFKVNNVRNYLKYTRRVCHFLSSCVGSTVFLPATARTVRGWDFISIKGILLW